MEALGILMALQMMADWSLHYSSQVEHLWFEQKQIRRSHSQHNWCEVVGSQLAMMYVYTLCVTVDHQHSVYCKWHGPGSTGL